MIKAFVFSVAATIWAGTGVALPVQWAVKDGGNGHWYEFVLDWKATWNDARTAAATSVYGGMTGYLVTITSVAENTFVRRVATEQYPFKKPTNVHIGLSDEGSEGDWVWHTGPGAGICRDAFPEMSIPPAM